MKKNIQLIEACSDLGAGTKGASFGPDVLQIKSQSTESNLLAGIPRKTLYVPNKNGYSSSFAMNIEQVYNVCYSIAHEVADCMKKGCFPLLISGDHSCAAGTIAGIKIAKPHSRLGVIWIDAHADIHSPFTTPSGNVHGMPLAASINEDNINLANRKPDPQTTGFWQRLKKLGNISPKILPHDIVYVSLRDYEKEEAYLINKYGIKCIATEAVRLYTPGTIVQSVFKQLEYCTDIYISFDTDSLDASISKGTGLPVNGGLFPDEAELLVALLMGSPKISCFEITELNPFFDINGETTDIIWNVLNKAIIALHKEETAKQVIRPFLYE